MKYASLLVLLLIGFSVGCAFDSHVTSLDGNALSNPKVVWIQEMRSTNNEMLSYCQDSLISELKKQGFEVKNTPEALQLKVSFSVQYNRFDAPSWSYEYNRMSFYCSDFRLEVCESIYGGRMKSVMLLEDGKCSSVADYDIHCDSVVPRMVATLKKQYR